MTHQDKAKRKLSTKLCTYIDDRNKNDEISDKIQSLIEQGADINFQARDYDGNTPLQIAIEKSDVKCVKYLLKLGANLEIKNDDGETAFDLAEKNKNLEILQLIQSDSDSYSEVDFLSISSECILEVETVDDFKNFNRNSNTKIVRTKNCQSLDEICKIFDSEEFREFVQRSPGLFALDVKMNGEIYDPLSKPGLQNSLSSERSWIIQVQCGEEVHKIFIKKAKKGLEVVQKIEYSNIDENLFLSLMKTECNFKNLMQGFFHNLLGTFNGNIFDAKLKRKIFIYSGLITSAERDGLCLRFLFVYSEPTTEIEIQEPPAKKLKLKTETYEQCENLLDRKKAFLNAIEMNDFESVKNLLKSEMSGSQAFSEIAWELKRNEILLELLKADLPFPRNFDSSSYDFSHIINAVNSFHKNIKSGSMEKVGNFVADNPKTKFAYDSTNKSALCVALEAKQLEIYAFLRSRGFSHGIDMNFVDTLKNLTKEEKQAIRNENTKYFKSSDSSHLFYILSKTKIAFNPGSYEEDFKIVRKMLEELNEIVEIRPILKAVEHVDLKITFDFNKKGVNDMIPSKPENEIGCCFYNVGHIYVGAQDHEKRYNKIIGTLIHELSHYVMNLIYRNEAKPFFLSDSSKEIQYKKIIRNLSEHFSSQRTINTVFRDIFKCYPKEKWQFELIVCVPEIIINYENDPDEIQEIKKYAGDLFDFFKESTLEDIKKVSFLIQPKQAIMELNDLLGTIHELWKSKIYFISNNFETKFDTKLRIIASNAPTFSMVMIFEVFYKLYEESCKCHAIFGKLEILNLNMMEKFKNAMNSAVKPHFIINVTNCTSKQIEMLSKLLTNHKMGERIILVSTIDESETLQELFGEEPEFYGHEWENFIDKTHDFLISKTVNFQGHEVKLSDIIPYSSGALQKIDLQQLFQENLMKVGESPENSKNESIIPRKFLSRSFAKSQKEDKRNIEENQGGYKNRQNSVQSNQLSEARTELKYQAKNLATEAIEKIDAKDQLRKIWSQKTFEEVLEESGKNKTIMISDMAGTGKTVMLKKIAARLKEKYPKRWVSYIDLKSHIESFKIPSEKELNSKDFVLQLFYRNLNNFDQAIFGELYKKGRTTLLFDSFDEISPDYKEVVTKFLKSIEFKNGNQIWVTTRSHLEEELEKIISPMLVKLEFLSKEEQIEFLTKSWKIKAKTDEVDFLQNHAKNFINQLESLISADSSFVGLPILIKMIAEIYKNIDINQNKTLSIYKIYKNFIIFFFSHWREERGEIAKKEQKHLDFETGIQNVMEVHQKLAIDHIIEKKHTNLEEETNGLWTNEMIYRVGIITKDEKRFTHETFAEYLVAQYLIDHFKKKSVDEKEIKLFLKILTDKDFQIIRSFLESYFDATNQKINKIFNHRLKIAIERKIKTEECRDIFKNLLREGKKNILNLIDFLNLKKSTLKEILLKTKGSDNFFYIAVESSKPMISQLFECFCLKSFPSENEAKKTVFEMFKEKDDYGSNVVLKFFKFGKSEQVFDDLGSVLRKVASPEEIKSLFLEKDKESRNILGCLASNSETNLRLPKVWTFLKTILKSSELFELLIEKDTDDESNALHSGLWYRNEEYVKDLLEIIKDNLNEDQKKILIESTDKFGSNTLHLACYCNNFSTIFNCLRDCFTEVEMQALIRKKNNTNNNITQYAASSSNPSIFTQLLDCLKSLSNENEAKKLIVEMFREKDDFGSNVVLKFFKFGKSEEVFDDLCSVLREVAKPEEIESLFLEKSDVSRNILGCFATNSETKLRLPKVWTFLQTFFNSSKFFELLIEKDTFHEQNALHLALSLGNEEYVKDLGIIEKKLNDDQKKILIESTDKFDSNILHLACYCKNFPIIFNCLRDYFTEVEMQALIRKKDNTNNNITQYAASSSNPSIFTQLLDCLKSLSNENEAKKLIVEMFREKDDYGKNVVLKFFKFGKSEEVFDDLYSVLREVAKPEEIKNLFLEKGKFSRNILGCFATNSETKLRLQKVWTFLNTFFNSSKFFELLIEKDNRDEDNALHLAISVGNKSYIKDLFEIMKYFNWNQRFLLIDSEDKHGNSIFHSACVCKTKNFETIEECLKMFLPLEEIKKMYWKTNIDGFIPLQQLARWGTPDKLEEFRNVLMEVLGESELKKMLLSKTLKKQNILHISLRENKNQEFVKTFLTIFKLFFGETSKEIFDLINEKDFEGKTSVMLAEELEKEDVKCLLLETLMSFNDSTLTT